MNTDLMEVLKQTDSAKERARIARNSCSDRELQIALNLELGSRFSKGNKVEHRAYVEGDKVMFYRFCSGEQPKKYELSAATGGAGIRFTLVRQGLMSVA